MIANARMYSVDAASAAAWRALLEWVLHRAGVEGEVVDHRSPLPLETLWSRPDLGCAFMCGYPFARATPQPIPLVALVPSPERYGGKPVYWTDLVVRDDAPLRTIADAFGRVIAYTTEGSQSGYQAPRRFLAPYARGRGGSLFASTIGPLITPRHVAEAIVTGAADIGPLDSYAHDLLRQNEPGLASRLRTIASDTADADPAACRRADDRQRRGQAPARSAVRRRWRQRAPGSAQGSAHRGLRPGRCTHLRGARCGGGGGGPAGLSSPRVGNR